MLSETRHLAPLGASRKRKDREPSDGPRNQSTARAEPGTVAPAADHNRLLAGFLAHEFLSRGTLFGKLWEPATVPGAAEPRRPAYAEVSYLLKSDAAHIRGVVNPTQLARWLQM